MTCSHCHIDITGPLERCPLCKTPLSAAATRSERTFPLVVAPPRKKSIMAIISPILLALIAVGVMGDLIINQPSLGRLVAYFSTGLASLVMLLAISLKWKNYMLQLIPLPVFSALGGVPLWFGILLCLIVISVLAVLRGRTIVQEFTRRMHF